jgi:type IV secretory pathway TraG/TraD family ATPase VirD4
VNTLFAIGALVLALLAFIGVAAFLFFLNARQSKFKLGQGSSHGQDRMPTAIEADAIWHHPRVLADPNALRIPGTFYCGTQGDQSIEGIAIPWETVCRGMITYGRPGSGKTVGFILRAIVNYLKPDTNASLVIVDPKGELWRTVIALCDLCRTSVKIFDLTDPVRTCSWNMLAGITDVLRAQEIAIGLIEPPPGIYNLGLQAQNLLAAMILHYQSFPKIIRNLNSAQIYADLSTNPRRSIRLLARFFINNHGQKKGSELAETVVGLVHAGLRSLIDPRTWVALGEAEEANWNFDPLDLLAGEKPSVVILKYEGLNEAAIGPFMGIAFSEILQRIYGENRRAAKRSSRKVVFCVDELYILGALPNLSKRVSDMRAFDMALIAAQQMIDQTDDNYKPAQAKIIRNAFCTNIVYAGCDPTTAEWFANLSGESTLQRNQDTYTNVLMPSSWREEEKGRTTLLLKGQIVQPPMGICTIVLPVPAQDRSLTGNLAQHYFFADPKPILGLEGKDLDNLRFFDEEELDFEDEFELEDESEDEVEGGAGSHSTDTVAGLKQVLLGSQTGSKTW